MPTYTFDFNLEAWIDGLEIEADSEEEAFEKLRTMSFEDIVDQGYCKRHDISDIDVDCDEYPEDDDLDDEEDYLDDEDLLDDEE